MGWAIYLAVGLSVARWLDRLMGKSEGTSELLQIENEMQRILTLLVLWEKEQKKQLAEQ